MGWIDYEINIKYRIATLRVRLALLDFRNACIKAGFRSDQSRAENGRWNGGGGSVIVTRQDKTGNPRIDLKTEQLVGILKDVVEKVGPGSGSTYGVQVHMEVASQIRNLDLPGIGAHGVEQCFSAGDLVRYGLDGSIRTDVIFRDGRTLAAPIMAIWDIKTGGARLSSARADDLRAGVGVNKTVPVIELHVSRGINVKKYIPSYRW